MRYQKPNLLFYRIAQIASWFVATFLFGRKILRNELRGKKGPLVVIANHESMLDFVNLIGLTARPMSFVISKSMYSSLPITGFMKKLGVIPKQQFQTTTKDMKRMRAVIEQGQPLVVYPAGLMCEDGQSTPIPKATYKFLKWLDADVYVARTYGSYFVMPKWSKKLRPGRTYIDVYKLIDREQMQQMELSAFRSKVEAALLFDAYREQEQLRVRYLGNDDLTGLENVLYVCPCCAREHTIQVREKKTLHCTNCGFSAVSDPFGILTPSGPANIDVRYVTDWNRWIIRRRKEEILAAPDGVLSAKTAIWVIDEKKHRFQNAGLGTILLSAQGFQIQGDLHGKPLSLSVPVEKLPSLPFSPGRYLELQCGERIYRCVLDDGRLVMKFINSLKILHEWCANTLTAVQ